MGFLLLKVIIFLDLIVFIFLGFETESSVFFFNVSGSVVNTIC